MKQLIIFTILIFTSQLYAQDVRFINNSGFNSIGTMENRTASMMLYDIDKDGDLDALVANGRHWAERNYIFFNNGRGRFRAAMPVGKLMDASYAMVAGDFNKDGFEDLAVSQIADHVPATNELMQKVSKVLNSLSATALVLVASHTTPDTLKVKKHLQLGEVDIKTSLQTQCAIS